MSYQKICGGFIALSMLVTLLGCVYPDAHESFKEMLNSFVGEEFIRAKNYYGRTMKWEVTELPNGNLEYRRTEKYPPDIFKKNPGPCTSIFEVDAKTKKIIRVDWEGSKRDCIRGVA